MEKVTDIMELMDMCGGLPLNGAESAKSAGWWRDACRVCAPALHITPSSLDASRLHEPEHGPEQPGEETEHQLRELLDDGHERVEVERAGHHHFLMLLAPLAVRELDAVFKRERLRFALYLVCLRCCLLSFVVGSGTCPFQPACLFPFCAFARYMMNSRHWDESS